MSTAADLKQIFAGARPLVEQWLDLAEEFAAFRDMAREKGIDWGQVKALLKAQVQDERDGDGEGKRVQKIIERADYSTAYADMLGLAKMNKKNFSSEPEPLQPPKPIAPAPAPVEPPAPVEMPDIPAYLDRRVGANA